MTTLEILKKYWGYESFRPPQDQIIESVLEGNDTLALLPTGGGKSICYQIPALAKEGVCLVISPLIALMKDQVYNLHQHKIEARAIFSGMSHREIDITLDNCIYGNVKLLYVSPERLKTDLFIERFKKMKVNLIAVDEAHCISQWGYDFRPPYLEIAEIREHQPEAEVLALTASATKKVAADIREKLEFRNDHQTFRKSFSRPNISFISYKEDNKPGKLIEVAKKVPGTGIIYVRNRRKTKDIASILKKAGFSADYYHAGLEMNERNRKQEAWITDKIRIMACTNAFGMGIDKPDVRFVLHLDLPDSLESYYQEAGRGGRDGKRSYAAILFGKNDVDRLSRNVEERYPPLKVIKKVYQNLCDYYQMAMGSGEGQSFNFEIRDFCKTYRLPPLPTFNALKILQNEGLIALTEAVYLSPRVKVTADRKTLYALEVESRVLAPVVQGILRSYEGAFDHYVNIREKQLAKMIGISVENLRQRLEQLQKRRVIYYEPYRDKPQVIFTRGRQDNQKDLGMDVGAIHFRRKITEEKVRGMLFYARNKVKCRERVILEYFGEQADGNCGHCDVCKEREKVQIREAEFDAIFEEVQNLLNESPKPLREIPSKVSVKNEKTVIKAIRWLTDQGMIKENDDLNLEWVE